MIPPGVALITAVLAVSWAAILVRLCEAPSLGIAFYRLLFATLVVAPWALRRRQPARGPVLLSAMLAGAFLALHFATWISSLAYTSVASSVVLVSTQPVFTAALAPLLLGERAGRRGWLAVALALAGIVLLAGADWRSGGDALLGDALALAGALMASLYLMIGRRVRESIGFARYLLVIYGSAAAVLGLMSFGAGTRLSGYPRLTWLWILLLALGPNVLGHSLLNWSVRRLRALPVNLAILGEPVLATVYAALLFGELPGRAFYVGAVLILGAILLVLAAELGRGKRIGGPAAADGSL